GWVFGMEVPPSSGLPRPSDGGSRLGAGASCRWRRKGGGGPLAGTPGNLRGSRGGGLQDDGAVGGGAGREAEEAAHRGGEGPGVAGGEDPAVRAGGQLGGGEPDLAGGVAVDLGDGVGGRLAVEHQAAGGPAGEPGRVGGAGGPGPGG